MHCMRTRAIVASRRFSATARTSAIDNETCCYSPAVGCFQSQDSLERSGVVQHSTSSRFLQLAYLTLVSRADGEPEFLSNVMACV